VVAIGGLLYSSGVTPEKMQAKLMGTWTIKQRLVAWQVATKMAEEKPVIGQGLGTYKINYFRYLAKVYEGKPIPEYMHHRYVQAHNDFVQLAGEMGWIGLAGGIAVLGLFWFSIPRYLWRRRPPPTEGLLVLSALLGTFGMSAFAISGFPFHIAASSAAWTAIAAMAGASLYRERREAYLAAQTVTSQGPGLPLEARWALTGALCVFAVSLMAFVYLPYRADEYTKEGMELYKQTKFKEAGEVLQKAIVLDPERGDARLVMGIVLAMLNRFPEAVEQFKRCQTSYDDVTLHYYLGRVYEAMGDKPAAAASLRRALAYFPPGSDVHMPDVGLPIPVAPWLMGY
jgi:Flp pilus assembly protein TadD